MNKMKILILFLDVSLSAQDQPTQRSIIDELADDLMEIFITLVYWTKLCQLKLKKGVINIVEDVELINEIMMKSLAVVEMLCTTKGTKMSLRDSIVASNTNPCIR
jgi:hypothetical protein